MIRVPGRGLAFVSLLLVAAAAFGQGNPNAGNPNNPNQQVKPTVVDRNGKVVGTLSAIGGVNFKMPDGRVVRLNWSRDSLKPVELSNYLRVGFRSSDCSGPAYVNQDYFGNADPLAVVIPSPGPNPQPMEPFDGIESPGPAGIGKLYVSETGTRLRLWFNDFTSHINYAMDGECAPGTPFGEPASPYPTVAAYQLYDSGIDLWKEFEFPLRLVE